MFYSTSCLNRYFCKSFLGWFGIVIFFLGIVIGIFEGIEMLRRSMSRPEIPLVIIIEMILLKIPSLLQRLLPFVVLLSGLLCFGRMQSTKEYLAFQSIGYSVWQFVSGLSFLCFALGLLNLSIILPLTSAFSGRLSYLEETLFSRSLHRLSVGSSGIWLKEKNNDEYTIIHADAFTENAKGLKNPIFYIFDKDNSFIKRIESTEAILLKSKEWTIQNPKINGKNAHKTLKFSSTFNSKQLQRSHVPPEAISFWDIPRTITMLEKAGLSVTNYQLFWHKQISKIIMFIGMLSLAVFFSFHSDRHKTQTLPIVLALTSGFIIYILSDIIYVIGLSQRLPVWVAAWSPSLITLLISIVLLIHKEDAS